MFLNSVKYITQYFSSRSQLPTLQVLKTFKGIPYNEPHKPQDFIKDETKLYDKVTISEKFKKIPYDEQYEQHDFKKDNKPYDFTKSNEYRFKYNCNGDLMIDKHYLDYDRNN